MFLALKDNASKLLLAVMESSDDTANAERILYNITPKALIDVIREAFDQGKEMDRQAELAKLSSQRRISSSNGSTPLSIFNQAPSEESPAVLTRQSSNSNETSNSEAVNKTQSTSDASLSVQNENLTQVTSDLASQSDSGLSSGLQLGETIEKSSTQERSQTGEHSTALSNVSTQPNEEAGADNRTENEGEDSEGAPPREVGHNLYILAHKLAKFNKELSILLKSKDSQENEALAYYAAHTAQIEVTRFDNIFS